jgi:hypothetical protein
MVMRQGLLPDDRRIGERADLGQLHGGQDDEHGKRDRGRGCEDRLDRKVADRVQPHDEEQEEHR